MGELGHIIEVGGTAMKVNIVFLVIAVSFIIDRVIAVFFKFNLNAARFMVQVEKLVVSDNIEKAVKLCNAAPKAALARVLRAGLTRSNGNVLDIGNAIEEETLAVTPKVMARISALWSLANICVLVGLFGTIVGLIKAFQAVGAANPEDKARLLTDGISEAMYNTAFGLLLAIICITGHLIVGSRARAIVEDIELHSLKLENMLGRRAAKNFSDH